MLYIYQHQYNQDIQKGLELISNMTTNDLKDIVLKELKQNENK